MNQRNYLLFTFDIYSTDNLPNSDMLDPRSVFSCIVMAWTVLTLCETLMKWDWLFQVRDKPSGDSRETDLWLVKKNLDFDCETHELSIVLVLLPWQVTIEWVGKCPLVVLSWKTLWGIIPYITVTPSTILCVCYSRVSEIFSESLTVGLHLFILFFYW